MCIVSDKIKFCTCVADDVELDELNHYWVLHRYNKNKDIMVLGLALPPIEFFGQSYYADQEKILNRLNSGEAFDQDFSFKAEDRLEVVFNAQKEDERLPFQFEFDGEEWFAEDEEFDSFSLMNNYDELAQGKIKEE